MIPQPKATILIVDDDPRMQQNLAVVLRLAGYEALFARDAHEGTAALENYHVDLMVLDYRLPGMDGMQFYETLLLEGKYDIRNVPVVVMTGDPIGLHEKWRFFRLGIAGLIFKGTGFKEMLRIIARELDARRKPGSGNTASTRAHALPDYLSYFERQNALRERMNSMSRREQRTS